MGAIHVNLWIKKSIWVVIVGSSYWTVEFALVSSSSSSWLNVFLVSVYALLPGLVDKVVSCKFSPYIGILLRIHLQHTDVIPTETLFLLEIYWTSQFCMGWRNSLCFLPNLFFVKNTQNLEQLSPNAYCTQYIIGKAYFWYLATYTYYCLSS